MKRSPARRFPLFLLMGAACFLIVVMLLVPRVTVSADTPSRPRAQGATPVPTDPLANWNGNPNSPTYDGRLNPHAAEYYTVYCRNDLIQVFRADGLVLRTLPIATVLSMNPAGSTLDLGSTMTIARNNDSVTIAGFNGNAAPASGRKEFSLRECLSRNGPLSSVVPTAAPTATPYYAPGVPTIPGVVVVQPIYIVVPPACAYTVQSGETAFRIARRYGISLTQLAQANPGIDLNRIWVGQVLALPGCTVIVTATPTATPIGPTRTPTPTVVGPTRTPTPTPTLIPGTARIHVVQRGENLFRIALRYGVPLDALARANGITNVRLIYVGQRLVIP